MQRNTQRKWRVCIKNRKLRCNGNQALEKNNPANTLAGCALKLFYRVCSKGLGSRMPFHTSKKEEKKEISNN